MSLSLSIPILPPPPLLLLQIKWVNRFMGRKAGDELNRCLTTVDGTDFRMSEPQPFSRCWWSQKFNTSALRYELVVCIATGDIVAFNGPFAPKGNPDINIFRYKLRDMLESWEQCVADKGYKGDLKCCTPFDAKNRHHLKAMSHARARHETINRFIKRWKIMRNQFRHHRSKHQKVFRAVVVMTQLNMNAGYKPWQLTDYLYSDPLFEPQ